jgi:hypothetical protein
VLSLVSSEGKCGYVCLLFDSQWDSLDQEKELRRSDSELGRQIFRCSALLSLRASADQGLSFLRKVYLQSQARKRLLAKREHDESRAAPPSSSSLSLTQAFCDKAITIEGGVCTIEPLRRSGGRTQTPQLLRFPLASGVSSDFAVEPLVLFLPGILICRRML